MSLNVQPTHHSTNSSIGSIWEPAMGSSAGSELHNVFVYGSLLADDVVRVLLNRVPKSSVAIVNGHHRFSIKGRRYPAIIPVENSKVTGKVLLGMTDLELHIFDEFEAVEYERSPVEVSLMENSDKLPAYAYVWGNKNDPSLYGDWNFEEWKRVHVEDYIKMTTKFMEELEQNKAKS